MSNYASQTYTGFETVDTGGIVAKVPKEQGQNTINHTVLSRIFSTPSAISAIFGNSSIITDFFITPSQINVPTNMFLTMNVTNTSGAPLSLLPVFQFLSYTEILIAGNTTEQIFPNDQFLRWLLVNPSEQIFTQQPFVAYNSYNAAFTPVILAPSASAEFILPLSQSGADFCMTQGLFLDAIRTEIRFRYHWQPMSQIITSGSTGTTGLQMTNLQLMMQGMSLSNDLLQATRRSWSNSTHLFNTVNCQFKTLNVGSLTANIASGFFVIQSSQALYEGMLVSLYDSATFVNETQITPEQMNLIVVRDASGSVINYIQTDQELTFSQGFQFPQSLATSPTASTRFYQIIAFCHHIRNAIANVSTHGSRRLTGFETIQIASANNVTNGLLNIYLWQLDNYIVDRSGSLSYIVRI